MGEIMNKPPSNKCGNCVWWYEGPLLCKGCPNNPETETMKVPRSQGKRVLFKGDLCQISYEENGFHMLCSEGGEDKLDH